MYVLATRGGVTRTCCQWGCVLPGRKPVFCGFGLVWGTCFGVLTSTWINIQCSKVLVIWFLMCFVMIIKFKMSFYVVGNIV